MNTVVRNEKKQYEFVSIDTASPCNARCIFCFNDWANIKGALMEPEVFEKTFPLLDMTGYDGFYVSCLFEPTLNPNFTKILSMIPEAGKNKAFFTTNLVKKLSEDELLAFSKANLDHINISLETYDRTLYDRLTGTKGSHFYENLERLSVLSKENGMKIRLITMILKSNIDELPTLIKRSREEISPVRHELRTPYYFKASDAQMDVAENDLLTRKELDEKKEALIAAAEGDENIIIDLSNDLESFKKKRAEDFDTHVTNSCERPGSANYRVRIESDGTGHFGHRAETKELFDLHDLNDPGQYFIDALIRLQSLEASNYFLGEITEKKKGLFSFGKKKDEALKDLTLPVTLLETRTPSSLDEAVLFDGRFLHLSGWEAFSLKNNNVSGQRMLLIKDHDRFIAFKPFTTERPDVAAALSDDSLKDSGFYLVIDTEGLSAIEELSLYSAVSDGEKIIAEKIA